MIFGTHDENTIAQFNDVASRAVASALMADGHHGYVMPIGGVAAYRNQVSIPGVGVDIACGNCAVRTNMRIDPATQPLKGETRADRKQWGDIANNIAAHISFGMGHKNKDVDAPKDHPLFEDGAWGLLPKEANPHNLKGTASSQLGTVGGGNHYVDVFVDEDGFVWVGVHFGSRGFGFKVANGFAALARGMEWGAPNSMAVERLVNLDTQLGQDYWALMELAGKYAYAGREWVARYVAQQVLGAEITDMVHNHHNFAWQEMHYVNGNPEKLVVVRKGATPAFPHERGFVGGSMGDNAVILEGTGSDFGGGGPDTPEEEARAEEEYVTADLQQQALFSTVHGAGRVMSRTEAAGKYRRKGRGRGEMVRPGKVTPEMMNSWMTDKGVILRGGGLDESPHAYRRLPDVLAAQGPTVRVLHNLRPLIVVMAGANEYDPFKD